MEKSNRFTGDDNGRLLKQMHDAGDDLTQPRMVDFCFVFSSRDSAMDFVRATDDEASEFCISYYSGKERWQVIAKYYIIMDYDILTTIEVTLTEKARRFSGNADGWGCMQILTKKTS